MLNNLLYYGGPSQKDLETIILVASLIYIVISIVLTVIAVKSANYHGRSGACWGLLVFFFGLIPFIILLATNKNTSNNPYSAVQSGWICSKCGQINRHGGNYCLGCYKPRTDYAPQDEKTVAQTVNNPTYTNRWTCPNCGENNNPNAKNCINCFHERP